MLFVTVGTHEQQFNRLVEYMDKWAGEHEETVIIQSGYSTYVPKTAKWAKLFSYSEMVEIVFNARIVITHGGPSSFYLPLQIGKTPVVVPRRFCFGEHVNDHQVRFCKEVESRTGNIIVVETIDRLADVIAGYDSLKREGESLSNNAKFCADFERIVDDMFKEESK